MTAAATTREAMRRVCWAVLVSCCVAMNADAAQGHAPPAPIVRMPPPSPRMQQPLAARGPMMVPRGAHLGQWMQQHNSMSPQQQQQALQHEPGFNQLPQQTQQRMVQRLNRLNSMPEQQRDRVLSRNEAMERMSPQQRGDVRSAMGQLGALPQDRRRAVARTFRELRGMSPEERSAAMNSPELRQQLTDGERGTLGNLLTVSPLLPSPR